MCTWCRERQASGARKALNEVLRQVEQTDLMTYGLIPEFVGRFPIVTTLQVTLPAPCKLWHYQRLPIDDVT